MHKAIADVLSLLDVNLYKQSRKVKGAVQKRNKRIATTTAISVNVYIPCISCGVVIEHPTANHANPCPSCGTLNPLFVCPSCFTTERPDTMNYICSHCRNSYQLIICRECGIINIRSGALGLCAQCESDISETRLNEASDLRYILAVQILIFRYVESKYNKDSRYSPEIFGEQYHLLLQDDSLSSQVIRSWYQFPLLLDTKELSALCLENIASKDLLILLHQTVRILSCRDTIEVDVLNFLRDCFISAGITDNEFNIIISEYFVIFTLLSNNIWNKIPPELRKYYLLLGLDENAEIEALKGVYYTLAKKYHPDANVNLPNVERQARTLAFLAIKDAYDVLLKKMR